MKPVEMPEFKHPSIRLESGDWGCLHCWTSNDTLYTGVTWTLIKLHLKEKCVTSVPSMFLSTSKSNFPGALCRHDVDKPSEDDYYCVKPTLQSDYFIREAAAM